MILTPLIKISQFVKLQNVKDLISLSLKFPNNSRFRLRSDGKVMYRHPVIKDPSGKRMESVFNNVEYCVDGVKNYGEDTSLPYRTRDEDAVLFVCAMNPPEGSST